MPLRAARANISSGSRLPSMWIWSSLFGSLSICRAMSFIHRPQHTKPRSQATWERGPDRFHSLALLGQRSFDALGQPIHAQDLRVAQPLSVRHLGLACLIVDRSAEDEDLARFDAILGVLRGLCHIVRHVGIGRHLQHAHVEAAPNVLALPTASHRGLYALDIVVVPMVDGGS